MEIISWQYNLRTMRNQIDLRSIQNGEVDAFEGTRFVASILYINGIARKAAQFLINHSVELHFKWFIKYSAIACAAKVSYNVTKSKCDMK